MFDTMTMTKAVGAVCGALLFLLLGNWVAESLYHVGGGHGDHEQAYVIDTGEDEVAEDAPAGEGPDFAEVFASADAAAGEKSWSKCRACHALEDGKNGVGPYLTGVMGRDVASADGYAYSDALQGVDGSWTAAAMNEWLTDPKAYAPGNKMTFAGIRSVEERADLIAFLGENSPGWEPEIAASSEGEAEEASADEPAQEEQASNESTEEDAAADDGAAEQGGEAAQDGTEQSSEEDAGAGSEDAASDDAASQGEEEQSAIAAAYDQADVANGQSVFRQCAACHFADKEQNRVGPHLVNVLGREIASVEGFAYSNALQGLDGEWTLEKLDGWLEAPMQYAKGTKMGFMGVKDQQARADVIAYIESLNE